MGLREQLTDDLKDAMRQQDAVRKTTIRSVIAEIKKAETTLDANGQRVHLDDQGIIGAIAKQARMRQESIVEFRKGGREDLVAQEEAELAILQSYLPQQLTPEEVEAEARQVITETEATGPGDLGKVMKALMPRLRGRADGRLANQIVRELLVE
jgi:uncharacterized protein YqeY